MGKQLTVREKLDLLELTVEIINTYSQRVYLVQQQVNILLKVVINHGFSQEEYKEILKHLKILQGLIEAKIHKKEGYEALMQ